MLVGPRTKYPWTSSRKGVFSNAEFSLIFTISDFRKKIRPGLDATAKDLVATIHDLFGRCLQVKASSKWSNVLAHYAAVACTANTFEEAQRDYLESVPEV